VHHRSGVNAHIQSLADGIGSVYRRTVRITHPYSREHARVSHVLGFQAGGNKPMTIQAMMDKSTDLCDDLLLEFMGPPLMIPQVHNPALTNTTLSDAEKAKLPPMVDDPSVGAVTYGHGLGWLWWQSIEFKTGNNITQSAPSDFMEAMSELRNPVGKKLRANVFKFENATWHTLAERSMARRVVCYTPIDLWFTRTKGHALSLSALGKSNVEVVVRTRAIKDFAFCLPVMNGDASAVDGKLPWAATDQKELNWGSEGLEIHVLTSNVYVPDNEANWFANHTHEYPVTVMQTPTNIRDDDGIAFNDESAKAVVENTVLEFPMRSIAVAFADANRTSLNFDKWDPEDGGQPFTKGVRALYGKPCGPTDYNVLAPGCSVTKNAPQTITIPQLQSLPANEDGQVQLVDASGGAITMPLYDEAGSVDMESDDQGNQVAKTTPVYINVPAIVSTLVEPETVTIPASTFVTSAGIQYYNSTTGEGPPLPGNRYEYRLADDTGTEVTPLSSVNLKLNNRERVNPEFPGEYYQQVQTKNSWAHEGRSGLHTYNFSLDSVSATNLGASCNFSQIENKYLAFTAGMKSSEAKEVQLRMYVFMEHYQIFVQKYGLISDIYAN
jgi:hypothetical protein